MCGFIVVEGIDVVEGIKGILVEVEVRKLLGVLHLNSLYKSISSFDIWSVEVPLVILPSFFDCVYKGLERETVVVVTSIDGTFVLLGCNSLIAGLLKGLLPLKGLLFLPGCPLVQPGFGLIGRQLSGSPPDPDKTVSSGLSTEGGLTVGGEGRVFDSGGASAVVKDLE